MKPEFDLHSELAGSAARVKVHTQKGVDVMSRATSTVNIIPDDLLPWTFTPIEYGQLESIEQWAGELDASMGRQVSIDGTFANMKIVAV